MTPSDRWFRWIYGRYAPVYDLAFARFTRPGRARSVGLLGLRPGARVLVPGCGTGLDFAHLPPGARLTAGDFAPPMLARARRRAAALGLAGADLRPLDAAALPFEGSAFDAVVLHLVVAVVPDPAAVLREARRVVAPSGRLALFDVFAPEGRPPGRVRRALDPLARPFVAHLTRRASPLLAAAGWEVERDEPALLGGLFRAVLARPVG